MAKKYNGETLVNESRYSSYIPQLSSKTQNLIFKRIDELIKENPEYCDKGNHNHLANIFTAISLYETLQLEMSKEEAFEIVSEEMWKTVRKGAEKFKKFMKIPYTLKLMGTILPFMFNRYSGYGWKYQWHKDKTTNDYLQFECLECIYSVLFEKYGVSELGPICCHSDVINYGDLPNIKFTRHHTLCEDGQTCDFLFTREK